VAILATGDEIAMPGEPIPREASSVPTRTLWPRCARDGGDPTVLPVAKDTTEAIAAAADQVVGFDLLVTTEARRLEITTW